VLAAAQTSPIRNVDWSALVAGTVPDRPSTSPTPLPQYVPKDTVARKTPPSTPARRASTDAQKVTQKRTSPNTDRVTARPSVSGQTKGTSAGSTSSRGRKAEPASRKARIDEVRKAQRSRERRTVVMIIAGCAALVLVLAGVIGYGIYDARRNQPENLILTVGAPASAASCDAVTTDAASGNNNHVGPGTNQPNISKISYSTVPPTSGSHFVQPSVDGRQFYTPTDTPAVETLVHNLEHGYTVLWYLPGEAGTSGDQLKQIAQLGNKLAPSQNKFIVAPWNESYGQFPEGKKYALSHWSAVTSGQGQVQSQSGHRQLCGQLSGEVVQSFVTQFPKTDAPEPLGA
jgi:Protein of unknown function (DUF3105)